MLEGERRAINGPESRIHQVLEKDTEQGGPGENPWGGSKQIQSQREKEPEKDTNEQAEKTTEKGKNTVEGK